MPRRISSSQLRSKLRQAQTRARQAQNKQRQAINKYNQAVRNFNRAATAHNARVRANRERLRRELSKLARSISQPRYASLRVSVEAVQRSYEVLETRAENNLYDDRYSPLLDLSEREAANSVSVLNALQGDAPETAEDEEALSSETDRVVSAISPDIRDRWRGALFSLDPRNPDAARHFCTSAREILTVILDTHAKDDDVTTTLTDCDFTPDGTPTRRTRIRYLLARNGASDDALADFVDSDIRDVVELFHVFNDGTHGAPGRFSHAQLLSIRARMEGAVAFLWKIISGASF